MQIPSKLSYRTLLNSVYSNYHRHHIAVNTGGTDTVADLELDKAFHAPAGAPRVLNGPVGGRGPGCWCILAKHDCVVHLIAAFHVVRNHTLFVEEPADIGIDGDGHGAFGELVEHFIERVISRIDHIVAVRVHSFARTIGVMAFLVDSVVGGGVPIVQQSASRHAVIPIPVHPTTTATI